jgi:DNA polymerase-3 subunit delta'
VYWLAPDGAFLKIDQVRELKSRLSLRAHEGRFKVAILEEVERFHPAAANALLKTLEEPSADTCFVLLAKSPRFVLPTIRSRCQAVRFAPLSAEEIESLLTAQGAEPEAAKTAARYAEGSAGRAKASLDASDELKRRVDLARRIESAAAATDPQLGLDIAEELAKKVDRQEALLVLDLLALSFRDAVCAATGAETAQPARKLGLARAIACAEAVAVARDAISRNANTHLVAEDLLFSLRRHTGATKVRGRS